MNHFHALRFLITAIAAIQPQRAYHPSSLELDPIEQRERSIGNRKILFCDYDAKSKKCERRVFHLFQLCRCLTFNQANWLARCARQPVRLTHYEANQAR